MFSLFLGLSSKLLNIFVFSRFLIPSAALISGTFSFSTCTVRSNMSSSFVSLVTCPNTDVAKKLSRKVVENKFAACVNIVPQVISVYQWEGKIEEDEEVLMVIKTSKSQLPSLIHYIETQHPYDVPEVISMQISDGSKKYLEWIVESTQPNN